jgi:hypothetical protein
MNESALNLAQGWTPPHDSLGPQSPSLTAYRLQAAENSGQRFTRTLGAPAVHALLQGVDERVPAPRPYLPATLTPRQKAVLFAVAVAAGALAGSVLAHRVKQPSRLRTRRSRRRGRGG